MILYVDHIDKQGQKLFNRIKPKVLVKLEDKKYKIKIE